MGNCITTCHSGTRIFACSRNLILPVVVMDSLMRNCASELARKGLAPRNDGKMCGTAPPHCGQPAHDPSRRTILSGRRPLGRRRSRAARCLICCRRRRRNMARGRRSNSAIGRSATPNWKPWSRWRPSAFLRAGYGKSTSVALFLGNSPDHPVNFFGALKAGARVVHLSPLDGEIALSHKLSDSGARVLVTSNLAALLPMALKFLDKGLLDRLIVCEDDDWGAVGTPQTPMPDDPRDRHLQAVRRTARRRRRNGRRSRPMTSRCCNIPAAPPACRRARC